jgi:predicted flap endonuclease-1-like 5' DNA nuclease
MMDLLREYWWAIAIAVVLLLALLLLLRPKQKVTLTDSTPVRPHMQHASTPQVDGPKIAVPADRAMRAGGDDLCRLKGVGPKFADALEAAGLSRFDQIAALSPDEVDRLDDQLGAFRGRLKRDRVVEQADFLAREDIPGFEAKFGKL